MDTLRWLTGKATKFIQWNQPFEEFAIMKVDIARDFIFQHQVDFDSFVEGQRNLRLPYGPKVQTWEGDPGSTNLRRGRGNRWCSSIYSKEEELRTQGMRSKDPANREELLRLSRVAHGRLRNEVRLRRPVLYDHRLKTVGDLKPEVIEGLHRKYFGRSGFDCEVGGVNKVKTSYLGASANDRHYMHKVLGILHMQREGLDPMMSPGSLRTYRAIGQRLGLTTGDLTGHERGLRLDYDSAMLIAGLDGV